MTKDYNHYSCPNDKCRLFNLKKQGNIKHRSWMGKDHHIERLRCTECKKTFSERKGTLMERAHRSEDKTKILLKCSRWGVCDEGMADIAEVDIKTVRSFREKAGNRAQEHHHQEVRNLKETSVQVDEAHSKISGKGAHWITPAIAMKSLLIIFVVFGHRSQPMADAIIREVKLRMMSVGMILSDGWKQYAGAILRYFGELITPERTGRVGRPKQSFWQAPLGVLYAQVVKVRDKKCRRVTEVICRAVFGGVTTCMKWIACNQLGTTIHTIHIERWFGTMRSCIAACRRKTRCCSKSKKRHEGKIWLFVDLYNWVIPHESLSKKGRGKTTPAMAAGLIVRPMSYDEYIWKPVHYDGANHEAWKKQADDMDRLAQRKSSKFCFKKHYERLKREVA